MDTIINNLSNKSVDLVLKIFGALLVLLIGFKIVSIIEKRLKKPGRFNKIDPTVKTFFISFATMATKVIIIIVVLSIVGVPMASLVTLVGSCAVAIGLALQGGLSNIAGSLMILAI